MCVCSQHALKKSISAGERRQVAGGVKEEAGRLSTLVSNGLKKRGERGVRHGHCRPVTVASLMITSTIHFSIHEPRRHLSLLHRLVSAGCSVPVSPNRPVDRLLVSAPLSSGGTPTYGRQLTSAPGAKESRRKKRFSRLLSIPHTPPVSIHRDGVSLFGT